MKGFTLKLMSVVLIVFGLTYVSYADNTQGKQDIKSCGHWDAAAGSGFATYKVDGCYQAGDAVTRNSKWGGSVGPFFNLTGINMGDPIYDPTNWYYCCGTPVIVFNTTVLSGAATNLVVPSAFNPAYNGGGGYYNLCVPLTGKITLPMDPFPNGGSCQVGGSGTLAIALNKYPSTGYLLTVDFTPSIPDDNSQMYIGFYDSTTQEQTWGGGSCWSMGTGINECTIPIPGDMNINDKVGLMFQYNPGSMGLVSYTFNTAKWVVTAPGQ